MSSMLIIFITAGALAAAAIVLAVVNWIYLGCIASRMADLDDAIGKKTIEFDALRKEMHHAPQAPGRQANPAEESEASLSSSIEDTSQIQIFRNVRTDYSPEKGIGVYRPGAEAETAADSGPAGESAHPAIEAASPEDTRVEQVIITDEETAAPASPPEPKPAPAAVFEPSASPSDQLNASSTDEHAGVAATSTAIDKAKHSAVEPPSLPEMEADVLDVVGVEEPPPPHPSPRESVVPLYSSAKKDADFVAAWKLFGEHLARQPGGCVNLDLNNILFLYDKETHHLEHMAAMAAKYKTKLYFINCSSDVARALGTLPRLAPLVKTA